MGRSDLIHSKNAEKKLQKESLVVSFLRETAKKNHFLVKLVKLIRGKNPSWHFLIPPADDYCDVSPCAEQETFCAASSFYIENQDIINNIPCSNGSRLYKKQEPIIGVVCDNIFFESMSDSMNFKYVSLKNWEKDIQGIDVLLVVSTWEGLNADWIGVANTFQSYNPKTKLLISIIHKCKSNGILTVFYSKEDPIEYNRFLVFAEVCDFIFTTAEECINSYIEDTKNQKVFLWQFSVNPLMYNPIGSRRLKQKRSVIFAGSWIKRHTKRCSDMEFLLDSLIENHYDVTIIDRNSDDPSSGFPVKYKNYIMARETPFVLSKIYKLFDFAININTIEDSHTMFSVRVYEMLASGSFILSNKSVGIKECFPMIQCINTDQKVVNILQSYSNEDIYIEQMNGVRAVMSGNTSFDRADMVFSILFDRNPMSLPTVAVIGDTHSECVRAGFKQQSYKNKKLFDVATVKESDLCDCQIIAFFSNYSTYGQFYLEDMINAFKYTNCDYITKDCYIKNGNIIRGKEHEFTDRMNSKYRTVFWKSSFDFNFLMRVQPSNCSNGYSIDRLNYCE